MTKEKLPITLYGNAVLRKKCRPVGKITGDERDLLDKMAEAMHASGGVGLAAPQVGVDRQLIVIDVGEGVKKFINPKILERFGGREAMEEGCLSIPDFSVKVKRARKVKVEAINGNGKRQTFIAEGLFARVLQHEIDHLQGVLIVDYLNFFKKLFLLKKLNTLKKTSP